MPDNLQCVFMKDVQAFFFKKKKMNIEDEMCTETAECLLSVWTHAQILPRTENTCLVLIKVKKRTSIRTRVSSVRPLKLVILDNPRDCGSKRLTVSLNVFIHRCEMLHIRVLRIQSSDVFLLKLNECKGQKKRQKFDPVLSVFQLK